MRMYPAVCHTNPLCRAIYRSATQGNDTTTANTHRLKPEYQLSFCTHPIYRSNYCDVSQDNDPPNGADRHKAVGNRAALFSYSTRNKLISCVFSATQICKNNLSRVPQRELIRQRQTSQKNRLLSCSVCRHSTRIELLFRVHLCNSIEVPKHSKYPARRSPANGKHSPLHFKISTVFLWQSALQIKFSLCSAKR